MLLVFTLNLLSVWVIRFNIIALYKKFGFVECGRVPHGIKFIDGSYTDLVTMIKVLK